MAQVRSSRGFTLVELMVVVSIIGMLASVAYPSLSRATLRSKSTERRFVMKAVHDAVEDAFRVAGRFPPDPSMPDPLLSASNPAGTAGTSKRPFDPTLAGWPLVTQALKIEGELYYSYRFMAGEGGAPFMWVEAVGDLDGDGVSSQKTVQYDRITGVYVRTSATPADGMEDNPSF